MIEGWLSTYKALSSILSVAAKYDNKNQRLHGFPQGRLEPQEPSSLNKGEDSIRRKNIVLWLYCGWWVGLGRYILAVDNGTLLSVVLKSPAFSFHEGHNVIAFIVLNNFKKCLILDSCFLNKLSSVAQQNSKKQFASKRTRFKSCVILEGTLATPRNQLCNYLQLLLYLKWVCVCWCGCVDNIHFMGTYKL